MKQKKKLMLGMTILFLITFIFLGTIVVTEKLGPLYKDKIKEKMNDYLTKNYKDEKDNLKFEKITYQAQVYKAKLVNKENPNLYFTMTYKNKKITDTYKKDYLKGNTILRSLEEKIEKRIKKNLNLKTTITFPMTLNKYSEKTKEKIINNDIDNLNIYNIELSINGKLSEDNIENLVNSINTTIININNLNITPNYYKINIINKGKTLTIKNLTNNTLEKQRLLQIINYIIMDNEGTNNILKDNNISYENRQYGDE